MMFEIKLFKCIKINLALDNLQWLKCHKTILSLSLSLPLSHPNHLLLPAGPPDNIHY